MAEASRTLVDEDERGAQAKRRFLVLVEGRCPGQPQPQERFANEPALLRCFALGRPGDALFELASLRRIDFLSPRRGIG